MLRGIAETVRLQNLHLAYSVSVALDAKSLPTNCYQLDVGPCMFWPTVGPD